MSIAPIRATPSVVISPSPRPGELPSLHIAVVDMKRLFATHPSTKASEDAINAKRLTYRTESQRLTDSGDADAAKRSGDLHKNELDDEANHSRQQIVADLQKRITAVAADRDFDLVLDLSGKTQYDYPFVLQAAGLPDITDDIIHELSP